MPERSEKPHWAAAEAAVRLHGPNVGIVRATELGARRRD